MRVSALPEDPGYATYQRLGPKTTVTLDGECIGLALTADEEEGFVDVCVEDPAWTSGPIKRLLAENGETVKRRLTGKVRIYAHPDLIRA